MILCCVCYFNKCCIYAARVILYSILDKLTERGHLHGICVYPPPKATMIQYARFLPVKNVDGGPKDTLGCCVLPLGAPAATAAAFDVHTLSFGDEPVPGGSLADEAVAGVGAVAYL